MLASRNRLAELQPLVSGVVELLSDDLQKSIYQFQSNFELCRVQAGRRNPSTQ